MRRIGTFLAVLLLFGYSLRSAGLPALGSGGASAIDLMFQAAVDKGEIPGVVAAITNKEQILYLKAFGKQNAAQGIPMSTNTVFRIASMTKPVTSVGVMMLYEQGKLKLDDAAGNYVPALKGREVIATFSVMGERRKKSRMSRCSVFDSDSKLSRTSRVVCLARRL